MYNQTHDYYLSVRDMFYKIKVQQFCTDAMNNSVDIRKTQRHHPRAAKLIMSFMLAMMGENVV